MSRDAMRSTVLAACLGAASALVQAQAPAEAPPQDPLMRLNRGVFAFNEAVDRAVLKPVATAYRDVLPSPVRTGIGNVFGNIGDVWSALNHFLQGKPQEGVSMTMRVIANTTLGIGGLLDWGTELGLEKQGEDFGQTLGRWGMPAGAYLVLPVLGPSTLRDTAALPLDMQVSPGALVEDGGAAAGVSVLQAVHRRSELLGASRVLDDVALDKYQFMRDAYLARRLSQVWDGNPPEPPADKDE